MTQIRWIVSTIATAAYTSLWWAVAVFPTPKEAIYMLPVYLALVASSIAILMGIVVYTLDHWNDPSK